MRSRASGEGTALRSPHRQAVRPDLIPARAKRLAPPRPPTGRSPESDEPAPPRQNGAPHAALRPAPGVARPGPDGLAGGSAAPAGAVPRRPGPPPAGAALRRAGAGPGPLGGGAGVHPGPRPSSIRRAWRPTTPWSSTPTSTSSAPSASARCSTSSRGGGGLVALHCASYCFRDSDAWVELVGAQFERHGTGTFHTEVVDREHPVTRGFLGFGSWDETYVHTRHNPDRTVLEVRVDEEGREPWTWVRTQGEGRVFYTAWGHDERTWTHPGFQDLVERGLRWASGDEFLPERRALVPFEHDEAEVPLYRPEGGQALERRMQLAARAAGLARARLRPGRASSSRSSRPSPTSVPRSAWPSTRAAGCGLRERRLPQRAAAAGPGPRPACASWRTPTATARADRFDVFAEGLSIPTSLAFADGGVIVTSRPTRCSCATPTATDARTSGACCSPAGARATRTRARATCGWASTAGSGAPSATRASRARRRRAPRLRPGDLPLPARRLGARVPGLDHQQHLGPRPLRDGRGLRLDRQRQTRATTWPCPTASTRASRAGTAAAMRRSPTTSAFTRSPRACARSTGTASTRRPRAARSTPRAPSRRVLEPRALRLRADRTPGARLDPGARRQRLRGARRLEPAGQRRRVDARRSPPRSGRTAPCG